MVRFILAGTQRTGTTLIQTTLDSHPDICAFGEVFLFRHGRGGRVDGGYRRYLNADRIRRYSRHYLARRGMIHEFLAQLGADRKADMVGFKLMLGQARVFPEIIGYVREYGVKVIRVDRRNALKTLLSRRALFERGIAHTREKLPSWKLRVPTRHLVEELDRIVQEGHWAEREFDGLPMLSVWYEDFVEGRDKQLSTVLDFLEVPYRERVKSSLEKLNPDKLPDLVENYDEVVSALRGTSYEQLAG